jgi:hypothetical protein
LRGGRNENDRTRNDSLPLTALISSRDRDISVLHIKRARVVCLPRSAVHGSGPSISHRVSASPTLHPSPPHDHPIPNLPPHVPLSVALPAPAPAAIDASRPPPPTRPLSASPPPFASTAPPPTSSPPSRHSLPRDPDPMDVALVPRRRQPGIEMLHQLGIERTTAPHRRSPSPSTGDSSAPLLTTGWAL